MQQPTGYVAPEIRPHATKTFHGMSFKILRTRWLLKYGLPFVGMVTFLSVIVLMPDWLFHWEDFRSGDRMVREIEAFRSKTGRLPVDSNEIGIDPDNSKVWYRKESDAAYILWFGTTLGESRVYDSKIKQWK